MNGFCGSGKKFVLFDPSRIYEVGYWIYVFTGCWQLNSKTHWLNVAYKIYRIVSILIYCVTLAGFTWEVYTVRNDLQRLSFNLSSSFLLFMTVGKVSFFYKERRNLEDILDKLDNHLYVKDVGVAQEDKIILKKKAEILYSLTVAFYVLLVLGLPMRAFADITITRTFLIPIPVPGTEPYFELLYIPQIAIIFHFLVTVLAHDLLLYVVILQFIGHYEIIEKNVQKIKTAYPRRFFEKYVPGFVECDQLCVNDVLIRKTNNSENVQKFLECYSLDRVHWAEGSEAREKRTFQLLKENINHHQKLLLEITAFNRLYSKPLLIQACGAGIIFGIVTLQVFFLSGELNALLIGQVIYMLTTLCNVFYFCSFATELKTRSEAIADALYDTPWYEMNSRNQRMIQIAIKKLIEGPKLKGGGQIIVNRETYLKFLRISYNLIAVLRQIY